MRRWRSAKGCAASMVGALVLVVGLLSCEGGMGPTIGTEVNISVVGNGDGVGRVSSTEPAVDIDCLVGPDVPNPGQCTDFLVDAGAGGMFSLVAEANPGSTFAGWSGCNQVEEEECFLSFDASASEVDFDVVATFAVDPNDECNMVFGSAAGYLLCSESETSCTFYTLLNDIDSCTTRCASFQATCLASIRDTDDTCTPSDLGSCDDVVTDRVCKCTKP